MAISDGQLQEWQQLADQASLGPWWVNDEGDLLGNGCAYQSPLAVEDTQFAAAAREAVPALIAEVQELKAALNAIEGDRQLRIATLRKLHAENKRLAGQVERLGDMYLEESQRTGKAEAALERAQRGQHHQGGSK